MSKLHVKAFQVLVLLLLVFPILLLRVGEVNVLSADEPSSSPEERIAQAEELFTERYVPETMDQIIALYEGILPELETLPLERQAFVLNRLAQLYYEKTTFSEGDTPEDRDLFTKGKEYGFRSLRLNADFAEWEGQDFSKALGFVTDVAALLWTADNWGALFRYNPFEGLANVGKVKAMYERCLEVDETFWGGSCHNALGALLVTTPGFLGGSLEGGREHLERAIEIDPDYLINHVVYAEYWGFTYDALGNKNGVRDRELIERELSFVLEAPIGEQWPFWNREAKKEAERLLEELKKFVGE